MDFAVPAGHMKIKESEKRNKYFDLARKARKLWNMRGTVILTVIGPLGTISKGLKIRFEVLEIGGGIKTI